LPRSLSLAHHVVTRRPQADAVIQDDEARTRRLGSQRSLPLPRDAEQGGHAGRTMPLDLGIM
jgi:hypothetical protein